MSPCDGNNISNEKVRVRGVQPAMQLKDGLGENQTELGDARRGLGQIAVPRGNEVTLDQADDLLALVLSWDEPIGDLIEGSKRR